MRYLALLLLLSGCSYTKPMTVTPMQLGPKEIPKDVVAGESSSGYLFGFRIYGNHSLAKAIQNAQKTADKPNTTMANVFIDRHLFCFPACWFPIFAQMKTSVFGTLIGYEMDKGGGQ